MVNQCKPAGVKHGMGNGCMESVCQPVGAAHGLDVTYGLVVIRQQNVVIRQRNASLRRLSRVARQILDYTVWQPLTNHVVEISARKLRDDVPNVAARNIPSSRTFERCKVSHLVVVNQDCEFEDSI